MMLQALCSYYQRAKNMPDADIIEPGYAMCDASGEIVLGRDGEIVAVNPLTEQRGKKRVPISLIVPLPPKRSGSRPEPAFLYETVAFLFGIYDKPDGAAYRFDASARIHHEVLDDCDDEGARAVLAFFDGRTLGKTEREGVDTALLEDARLFMVFRLSGDDVFVHERPAVRKAWEKYIAQKGKDAQMIQCLITGEMAPLARLHGNISGFGVDKPTLVGFNQDAFCSFGKYGQQGANAPVGERAAFEYVTALNMLCRDQRHYTNLGNDKLLFWAERDAPMEEESLYALMGGSLDREDDMLDSAQRDRIRSALDGVYRGGNPKDHKFDPDVRFFILSVCANKTRLVVRFFHDSTFGAILDNMMDHYRDIAIVDQRRQYPSPYRILAETTIDRKASGAPPNLDAALMRSILNPIPYPPALYQGILRRVRADGEINALRAGILKGAINRQQKREVLKMALDPNERDVPYLLGRLFAMYEKAQRDALGDVNASICDKYLNAALASPQMVFPTLEKLGAKHMSKSEYGYAMKWQISEVIGMLGLQRDGNTIYAYPETLDSNAQGKFIVGYHHQMRAFYTKKDEAQPEGASSDNEEGGTQDGHREAL